MSLSLEQFELRAFGPFTGTVLDLSGNSGVGLHVICGNNESGKSTTQRAIGDLLFGIPARTTDNHVHAYGDMRLAAVLVDGDGQRFEVVRRKGTSNTLADPRNTVLDEGLMTRLVGGMSREAFEQMFSITHESLLSGGKALLAADGSLGESLFSASLGASQLHTLRTELAARADDLFRPNARKNNLILQARGAYDVAVTELRELTLRTSTYSEHEKELARVTKARAGLLAEISRLTTENNERRRLRGVIGPLARRQEILDELSELGDVPDLPADAAQQRTAAITQAAAQYDIAAEAARRADELREEMQVVGVDAVVIEHEATIKSLHGRIETVTLNAADIGRQQGKYDTARAAALQALLAVRPDLNLDQAEQMRLNDAEGAAIDAAVSRHTELNARLDEATLAAKAARDADTGAQADLEAATSPPDTSRLLIAIAAAQAEGAIEQRLADSEGDLAKQQRRLADELRALDPAVSIEQLRTISAPSSQTVSGFVDELDAIELERQQIRADAQRLAGQRRDHDAELARLAVQADRVPTVAELTDARSTRDETWTQLRDFIEGHSPTPAPSSAHDYEQQVEVADRIADDLRADATAVARGAELKVAGDRLDAEDQAIVQREQECDDRARQLDQRWETLWTPVGLSPAAPKRMAEWLTSFHVAAERDHAAADLQDGHAAIRKRISEHVDALKTALAGCDVAVPDATSLAGALTLAQAQHRSAEAQAGIRRDAELAATSAQRAVQSAQQKAVTQQDELDRWKTDWAAQLAALGWPGDVSVQGAARLLDRIDELFIQLDNAASLQARIVGMQERDDAFNNEAVELVIQVAPDIADRAPIDAVSELGRRLDTAIQSRTRRESKQEQLDDELSKTTRATTAKELADRQLTVLLELAGVDDADALPEVEHSSQRARSLRESLPTVEADICKTGQSSLEQLIADAAGLDVDVIDAEIAATQAEIEPLNEQLAEQNRRVGELNSADRDMQRTDRAALAAEAVAHRIAELRELTERYLVLYLAGWALSEAVDRYRQDHKSPLLARANELFPRLTSDGFKALEIGWHDSDDLVLIGRRHNEETVPVTGMSTGTREQLFLALRLASLERHVRLHGPIPVFLDDVVLHSDPGRKTEILRALGDLAHGTQVIMFTHDPGVVALAQSNISPEALTVHELGPGQLTTSMQPQISATNVRPIRSERPAAA